MAWIKINSIVSMYEKPALGDVKAKTRYMALSIDRKSKSPYIGVAREITKSKGSVDIPGFIDESKLIIVKSQDALNWKKKGDLKINGISEIIKQLAGKNKYFIGLEDPDVINEGESKHVYFTIAFKINDKDEYEIYLGHAEGKNLDNLIATYPVLSPIPNKRICGFKEACIFPKEFKKYRFSLNETGIFKNNDWISAISLNKIDNFSKAWKFKEIILDPRKMKYSWVQGHASPCRIIPRDLISLKNKNLIVIINGREPEKIINGKKVYGKFRPGLIIYNIETGKVPWVAPQCLFEDPDARTITFASDFIQTKPNKGILYAHVNDSFIRAYKININKLKDLLPKKI